MKEFELKVNDLADTHRLGAALGAALPAGSVVALDGTLGAGKTHLVQALGAALGVPSGTVVSPTFVLIQEYQGDKPIYHFDAYRLRDLDEFLELGPEEYYHRPGITLIEWAERIAPGLPAEYLAIRIEVTGDTQRNIALQAYGETYEQVITSVAEALGA
ncbi:MAG: tRNA (adenosine(37)-N6)-threonylcarbamoyltransferase complex ATPase subunit type 1 TsaE [Planctomycetales bacterium]|nr:tRNA (adenosine(37)-N6)-threonylcarbamoyltransferase complex ATPase subunit type 1 TsaE [Planctomycetales bacterium]